jgi:hypothetical protein
VEPDPPDSDRAIEAEPLDAAPPLQPPPAPAARIFVVAAPRTTEPPPEVASPVEDAAEVEPLFVVPAVQPSTVEPPARPVPTPAPEFEPSPVEPPVRPRPPPAPELEPSPVIILEPEPEPVPERRGRRFWRPGCFTILLLLVVAIVAGGAYAYQTRAITPRLVLEAAGFGAAEVALVNLRDDSVRVDLATGDDDSAIPASFRLGPLEIRTHRAPRPTRLRIALSAEDGSTLGACALDLRSGDRFEVVALPSQTLLRRAGTVPASGGDLLLSGSSLCQ